MTPSDQYRKLAAQLDAKARQETNSALKAEWGRMAKSYLRLAEQADRNQRLNLTYEPILQPLRDQTHLKEGDTH